MNKHGDQFLEMFKESFGDFSPEVPTAVYAGVRKKMFWSNFMGFNMAQLNIWYVLLATSSVALLSWSNMEQESIGSIASESAYEISDLREPLMASVNTLTVEASPNTAIQFSPQRTTHQSIAQSSCASTVTKSNQLVAAESAEEAVEVAHDMEVEIAEVHKSKEESAEAAISTQDQKVVEEFSEIAQQENLPVNMGGSLVEDSNLVDQLKKNDGPIELNIHVKKTSTKEK